ncbi:hypothetical protein ACFWZ2_18340 [Streptomyces sp. NPDC059002]|uniref:hypothetical protein n=1 Tax=Streptomyces sp. NPDC059002 TaxID=3346690 RepID=UPI00367A4C19
MPYAFTLPAIRLPLDGITAVYLLEDPGRLPAGLYAPPGAVYDPRVHAAWVLARQGHRTSWLAANLGLPRHVTRMIVDAARYTELPARVPLLHSA